MIPAPLTLDAASLRDVALCAIPWLVALAACVVGCVLPERES